VTGAFETIDLEAGRQDRDLTGASTAFHAARELLTSTSLEDVAGIVVSQVSGSLGAPAAVYVRGAGDSLALTAASEDPARLGDPLPLVMKALASGSVALAPQDSQHRVSASAKRRAAVPIKTASALFGVLVVDGVDETEELRLLQAIADLVAATVEHRERAQASAAEARLDPLTGLWNNRAFHERLDGAIKTAQASDDVLSIVVFDLDNFKQINDREGHLVGDRVLRDVGRVTLSTLRGNEDAYRLGGEEFAVLIAADKEGAALVADRLREALALRRRDERLPSISAGVATFPDDGRTTEDLLHKADVALYAAKERGKNRVVAYSGSLSEETTRLDDERQQRLEGEWWLKVLGAASRGIWPDDELGPGWSPHDVARLADLLARELGLPDADVETVALGAVLVELSKLGIPEAIKAKRGRLSPREAHLVRERTGQMVSALAPIPHLADALPILRSCRERWDGQGHPDRLAGDTIPLGARIVAVCDAFCALLRARSYRPARTRGRALLELQERAGTRFDPACVRALIKVVEGSSSSA
jgi:diguanylate cyclase (GGDEF)-like protein